MTLTGYWLGQAACTDVDPAEFHAPNAARQQHAIEDYCLGCPVRVECLADALATDAHQDHGVRGGMTRKQRQALRKRPDVPTGRDPVTIAALRELLDQEQPDVPRHPTPRLAPRPRPRQTKESAVSLLPPTPTPTPAPQPAEPAAQPRSIADFLTWAEDHAEAAVRKQAATARASLAAIQHRFAAESELGQVRAEMERMRQRLAKLQTREKELARPGAKAAVRDFDPATVRAWAWAQGLECPKSGVVPKAIVAAWRERDST